MDRMKAQWIFLVTVFFLRGDIVTSQSEDITIFFQVNPSNDIKEGLTQQLVFACQVLGSFVDGSDRLTISRTRPDEPLDPLVSTTGKYANAPNNVHFHGWSGVLLTMSVRPLNRSDSGEYICQASRLVGSSYTSLGHKNLSIDILFPASGKPLCETLPANPDFTWNNGSQITARCASDAGNPTVTLQWFQANNVPLPGVQLQMSSDKVISTVPVTLDYSVNGAYLICTRLNQAFEANNLSCRLGPFMIHESTDKPPMTSSTTETTERVNTFQIPTAPSSPSTNGNCPLDRCPSDRFGVGIGVGITMIVVLEVIVASIVFFMKRRQKQESTELQPQNPVKDEKAGTSIYADLDQTERQASPYTELKPNVNHVF